MDLIISFVVVLPLLPVIPIINGLNFFKIKEAMSANDFLVSFTKIVLLEIFSSLEIIAAIAPFLKASLI
jgi:hypothetical protein